MTARHVRGQITAYVLLVLIAGTFALGVSGALEVSGARESVRWVEPWAFILFFGCALVLWIGVHLRHQRAPALAYVRVPELALTRPGLVAWTASLPVVLRVTALGIFVAALARPQVFLTEDIEVEGIDIMIVLDLSKSMEERDLSPDRLAAGQRTIASFLDSRRDDRVGLGVFAQAAMLQCPLTDDYGALGSIVADAEIGDVPEMGTAIGDALGLSLASLRRSSARSKVVILLSDGDSNWITEFEPTEARDLASRMGVKVFTILLGAEVADMGAFGRQRYSINPELLKSIASATGGRYFRAGDDDALEQSFGEVRAELEKSRRRVIGRVAGAELFHRLLPSALILLLLELLLRLTRWRRFP